jgi:hypothetical protein
VGYLALERQRGPAVLNRCQELNHFDNEMRFLTILNVCDELLYERPGYFCGDGDLFLPGDAVLRRPEDRLEWLRDLEDRLVLSAH